MIGLLRSEWIKLFSTKGAYWLFGLAIVLPVGMAILLGQMAGGLDDADGAAELLGTTSPTFGLKGAGWFTYNLVWIAAIVGVTGEMRYNTLKTTFLAEPRRWPALLAKTALLVACSMVVTFVAVVLSLLAASTLGGMPEWSPFSGEGLGLIWRYPVQAGIGTIVAVGLALLMRNAAGAVATLLVWVAVVESAVMVIPRIGATLHDWMPFHRGSTWVDGRVIDAFGSQDGWSPAASLLWFLAMALVVYAGGVALTLRRDA